MTETIVQSTRGSGKQPHSAAGPAALLTLACAASALAGWYLLHHGQLTPGRWLLLAAYISGSWLPLRAALESLREKGPDINLLMLMAAWGPTPWNAPRAALTP